VNIVEMIASQFGPQIVGAIANALGIEKNKAQSGISSSIPAVLAGLVGLTSKPGGTQTFSNAMNQADPSFLDNLTGALDGGKQSSLIETGTKMLGSLFGDNKLGALVGALAGAIGIKSDIAKSLIGMAAPAVMGLLKKEQQSRGLDVGGLVKMLQGEKQSINAALPADLRGRLDSAGLLEGFSGAAARAAPAAAKAGSSLVKWLIVLLVLAALGWAAWQYLLAPSMAPTTTSAPGMTRSMAASNLMVNGVNVGQELGAVVSDVGSILSNVKDAASAQAAYERLTGLGGRIDAVAAMVDQLPAAGRTALAELIGPQFAKLESMAKQVLQIPGVGPVLTPVVMPILAQISSLLNP